MIISKNLTAFLFRLLILFWASHPYVLWAQASWIRPRSPKEIERSQMLKEEKIEKRMSEAFQMRWSIKVTQQNKAFIAEVADTYNVDPEQIAYILAWEHFDTHGFSNQQFPNFLQAYKDRVQDFEALRGSLRATHSLSRFLTQDRALARLDNFRLRIAETNAFKQQLQIDKNTIALGQKPPARNGNDAWLFATIGPAQFQVYFAMVIHHESKLIGNPEWAVAWKQTRFQNKIGPDGRVFMDSVSYYDIERIARDLLGDRVAIELVAAELRWAIDAYDQCGMNIWNNHTKLLHLHLCGYFQYYADRDSQR